VIFGLLNEVFRVSTNARHAAFFIRMNDRHMVDWKDFGMRCQAAVTIKLVWKQQRWTVAHFIMETACTLDHPHAHDAEDCSRCNLCRITFMMVASLGSRYRREIILWGAGIGVKLIISLRGYVPHVVRNRSQGYLQLTRALPCCAPHFSFQSQCRVPPFSWSITANLMASSLWLWYKTMHSGLLRGLIKYNA
jgi:hypothetical protein